MDPLLSHEGVPQKPFSPKVFFGGVVLCAALSVLGVVLYEEFSGGRESLSNPYEGYACNVLGLNIHGEIVTYIPPQDRSVDTDAPIEDVVSSEEIVATIEQAAADDSIKAILLDIDSPGGLPVAAEEIAAALKQSKLPSASVIRQTGVSAAYWIASATDRVFASRNSDVGSIGVTMSYVRTLNEPGQYVELVSGKFKDTGNPDKVITQEERTLLLRDLDIIHRHFIEDVAQNRRLSVDAVRAIADGSSVLGEQAKSLGLVDEIGSWNEAKAYLKGRIGEDVAVCW